MDGRILVGAQIRKLASFPGRTWSQSGAEWFWQWFKNFEGRKKRDKSRPCKKTFEWTTMTEHKMDKAVSDFNSVSDGDWKATFSGDSSEPTNATQYHSGSIRTTIRNISSSSSSSSYKLSKQDGEASV